MPPKKFFPFPCLLASVILAIHAIAGPVGASYDVGFDYNYRSYDAIFPPMRESFLEEDRTITSFIEKRQSSWHDRELVTKTIQSFRAEYPEAAMVAEWCFPERDINDAGFHMDFYLNNLDQQNNLEPFDKLFHANLLN